MVLAHGPDPTIAFVSDMEALARPRQGVIHHAHMFSHNGYGPGTHGPSHPSQGPYRLRMQWSDEGKEQAPSQPRSVSDMGDDEIRRH